MRLWASTLVGYRELGSRERASSELELGVRLWDSSTHYDVAAAITNKGLCKTTSVLIFIRQLTTTRQELL